MNTKKFIGGGFPGIKLCIDEKDIISKESREKREFSVRKIIPINQLLSKNIKNNDTENLNVKENVKYDTSEHIYDINLINGPLKNRLRKKSKRRTKRK